MAYNLSRGRIQKSIYIWPGRVMSQGYCAHALPLYSRKGARTTYQDLQHPRDLKHTPGAENPDWVESSKRRNISLHLCFAINGGRDRFQILILL